MSRFLLPTLLLTSSLASAQIVSPAAPEEVTCGSQLRERDVLVLDLESFGDNVEGAQEFIARYVDDLALVSAEPEVLRTNRRTTRRKREHGLERAQSVAANRGCNVALVLAAWVAPSGVVFAQDFGNTTVASELLYAFAEVLFATGSIVGSDE